MDQITNLRLQAYRQVINDLKKRLVTQPKPTSEELFLGCYVEMLEPQVREAVREMNQKGYTTSSSGFYTTKQAIDGFFKIPPNFQEELKNLGAITLEEKNYTTISFMTKQRTLSAVKNQWLQIVRLLPQKTKGEPSDTLGSDLFRKNPIYAAFYSIGELEYYCARLRHTHRLSYKARISYPDRPPANRIWQGPVARANP